MKTFIEWLEQDNRRLRKVIAVYTAIIWLVSTIVSYVLFIYDFDTLAIYGLVSGQFATVVGFYMATNAEKD